MIQNCRLRSTFGRSDDNSTQGSVVCKECLRTPVWMAGQVGAHRRYEDNCVFSDLFDSLASMGNCFCRSFCVSSDRKYWFDLIKIVCSLWPQVATGSRKHFLTFYCGKIACHCGETRMCKWKWSKTVVCGALLDVLMTILRKAVSSARSVFELRCEWLDRLEHTDGMKITVSFLTCLIR